MSKRPSEMNVVDRIFYDIKVHGIQSVMNNKEFYQNYESVKLHQPTVSGQSEQCLHTERIWTIDPYDQKCFKCVKCGEYGV